MTSKRPRVLFVGAFPLPENQVFGGAVTSCRALLASTLPERMNLDLLDSTQISNPPPALPIRLLHAVARFFRYIRRFEANRPDAVLLFVSAGASIVEKGAMAWYARLRRVPSIMFPRSGAVVDVCQVSALTLAWSRICFRGARKIICQSKVWKQFATDALGFAAGDVTVVRNWTATPKLLKIGKERLARSDLPVRLIFVGWVERNKGIIELIDVCQKLHDERDFTLDVVGDGHASGEARKLVAEYGLDDVVRFRGWLKDDQVCEVLREADVFVLPSWAEGLPNALVEAMATRLAVVVTSVGAIPDIVADRSSGLLVAPKNAGSLAEALVEVIDNPGLRASLATEAHRVATREFGVEAAVAGIVGVVESIVTVNQKRNDQS